MKRLLLILILTFSFQALAKADDIRDFEIEGMSIGDSLLKFYSKNEILKKHQKSQYPNDKYIIINLRLKNYEKYSWVQIDYKKNDDKFKIASIAGTMEVNADECYKLQKEISSEFENIFPNSSRQDGFMKKEIDKTGNSISKKVQFFLKSGDVVQIACDDYTDKITKEKNFPDVLMVSLASKKYFDFMINEAFN
jgi:hypothetical protein